MFENIEDLELFRITTRQINKDTGVPHNQIIKEIKSTNFQDYGELKKKGNKYLILNARHHIMLLTIMADYSIKADEIFIERYLKSIMRNKEYILKHHIGLKNDVTCDDLRKLSNTDFSMNIISSFLEHGFKPKGKES